MHMVQPMFEIARLEEHNSVKRGENALCLFFINSSIFLNFAQHNWVGPVLLSPRYNTLKYWVQPNKKIDPLIFLLGMYM